METLKLLQQESQHSAYFKQYFSKEIRRIIMKNPEYELSTTWDDFLLELFKEKLFFVSFSIVLPLSSPLL